MNRPTVSFVVLCYKLGHYLGECLSSILAQSYANFEILVMDDCSPDETPQVARSFPDPRVHHIRQPVNRGGYANLNDGLARCRGEFVWIISADDYLRDDHALEKYLQAFCAHPEAGLVFCPSLEIVAGVERAMGWGNHGPDKIVYPPGKFFVRLVQETNIISGSSALVRKEFYDRFGLWPMDIPHAADCYIFSLMALYYGVVYLPQPMMAWRRHELQWTEQYENEMAHVKASSDIAVRWRLRAHARQQGMEEAAAVCETALVDDYVERLVQYQTKQWKYGLTLEAFESSLRAHAESDERDRIHARIITKLFPRLIETGDQCYSYGDVGPAKSCYLLALRVGARAAPLRLRLSIIALGVVGRKLANCRGLMRRLEALVQGGSVGG